jgi:hypothetical protein
MEHLLPVATVPICILHPVWMPRAPFNCNRGDLAPFSFQAYSDGRFVRKERQTPAGLQEVATTHYCDFATFDVQHEIAFRFACLVDGGWN